MPQLAAEDVAAKIERVWSAEDSLRSAFTKLVDRAGLDPSKDLRYGNWSNVDFSGSNLTGYDFTGSALHGCKFAGAYIKGARFAQCEYGLAHNFRRVGWSLEFDSTPLCDVTAALDWAEAREEAMQSSAVSQITSDHLRVGARFRDDIFGPLMTIIPSLPTYKRHGLSGQYWAISEDLKSSRGEQDTSPHGGNDLDWLSKKFGLIHKWRYYQIGVIDWAKFIGVSEQEVHEQLDVPFGGGLFSDHHDYESRRVEYESAMSKVGKRYCRLVRVLHNGIEGEA